MKKLLLKISIAIIITLFLLLGAGLWYAQKVFLPKKLKPMIIETALKSANLKIDLTKSFSQ